MTLIPSGLIPMLPGPPWMPKSLKARPSLTSAIWMSCMSKAVEDSFSASKEDFNLLFPAFVPAFGLKKKNWLWVLSDQLRDVAWNMVTFESLQLEKATKHLVQALIKGHKANSTAFDDLVPGKGQGLVFLLHGYVVCSLIKCSPVNETTESLD